MISERELRRTAARVGLGVGETEHEYVVVCALDALGQTAMTSDMFCLKGGTALRQFYFADWRHSVDLDFSVLPAFAQDQLRPCLEDWFAQIGRRHGVDVTLADFHPVNGMARVRARCVGPLRHPRKLLLDITLDEPILLPPPRRRVVTALFSAPFPEVLVYALEEIVAEKLRSIVQRGKARDYYDVWRLLSEKQTTFNDKTVRNVLAEKCRHKGLPAPTADDFFGAKALTDAEAYWKQDLAGQIPSGVLPVWADVVNDLRVLLPDFLDVHSQRG